MRLPPTRGRRVWIILAVGASLTVAAALGGAWYLSGRLIAITHVHDTYPLRIVSTDATTIVLSRGPDATEPGTFRLGSPGGRAIVGPVLGATHTHVTRRLLAARGRLVAGQRVGIEPGRYTGDPRTALGLPFVSEPVGTPLGAMPAWFVPGRRRTWVILVHGLGGSRADVLPPMPILHAAGYPMLAITYRNDTGAPKSPDHRSYLGATEWHDLAAAIVYARRHGARGVVLYGYSLGGGMALVAAREREVSGDVRALVLDSPVLDWPATLSYDAGRHGLPQPFVTLTETLVAWRIGIDWSQFDQLAHERQLRVPVLLFQGSSDTVVPPTLAGRFAQDAHERITYVSVPGADHVSAIDTEPATYRRALVRFLAGYP